VRVPGGGDLLAERLLHRGHATQLPAGEGLALRPQRPARRFLTSGSAFLPAGATRGNCGGGVCFAPGSAADRAGLCAGDEVVGLRGLDIIGASPSLLGLDVGVDINAANKAVRGAKPLSRALASKFIALATKALQAANLLDTQDGATARRDAIIESLGSMQSTIDAHPTLDPLPEAGAQNSPAEMLRNKVLQAITEYNSAAQGVEDLSEARAALWQDFVDSAKNLATKAGETASSILTYLKWLGIAAGVILVGGGCYIVYEKGMKAYAR